MRKKKAVGRPPKDPEKKLAHKIQVGLSDTDYSDLEMFKKDAQVEEDSEAMRRAFRWAMNLFKAKKGEGPSASP